MAMPSCHGAEGLQIGPIGECCLSEPESEMACEIPEVSSPPQPTFFPDFVATPTLQDLEAVPVRRAPRHANARGVPLFTLLCTLLS